MLDAAQLLTIAKNMPKCPTCGGKLRPGDQFKSSFTKTGMLVEFKAKCEDCSKTFSPMAVVAGMDVSIDVK